VSTLLRSHYNPYNTTLQAAAAEPAPTPAQRDVDDPDAIEAVRLFFPEKFTLEDAIGSHACSLEANMRVTNGIPLGSSLSYQLTL
jgi:hypothetical protein